MAKKKYECTNKSCSLGAMGQAGGKFTDGLSVEIRDVLGLGPDHPTGPGYCPNCGQKGKAV